MHVTKTFRDLGVDGALCDALEAKGIIHPFPIQELTLPLALQGHDLIGQARTGTGKTLAFGLPLLQRLDPGAPHTQALVVVPTRELCLQVYEDLQIGAGLGLSSISVYGGVGYDEQIDALTQGAHVVVGTPGRLLDLLNRRVLDLSQVTQLVLDEADEMLDMGFLPDVERLIEACKGEDRHTMLFSATMPTAIVKLARRYMDHPTFTRADHEQKETADNVTQFFFQVHRMDKPRLLARILQDEGRGGVYVFVRTKHMADRLVNDLEELRVPAVAIHGDLRQQTREKNLDRFREGKANVLVCTEVAARGLDVSGVTHVVNYDCPDDEKMYLHRIGRTARAGEAGAAITFAEFNEIDRLNVIRKKVGATDAEVQQVFSTSPVLSELFTLPETNPWDHLSRPGASRGGAAARGGSERDGASKGGAAARGGSERDGGARRGGGASRGGARSSTDGRPKSGRASEGRGGSHDARRDRGQPSAAPEDRAPTPTPDSSPRSSDDSRSRAPRGAGGDAAPPTPSTSRTRTRTRTRTAATDRPTETRSSTAGPADDTRRGDEKRDEDRPAQAGGRRRATTARARAGEDRRDPAADDTARQRDRSKGSERSNGDRSGGGERSKGGDRSNSDRSKGGDRSDSERSRGGRSGSGRGGRGRGRTDARDGDQVAAPVKLENRGRAARGEGQPQLARQVKVEHLP